jgi:hypothetical protein
VLLIQWRSPVTLVNGMALYCFNKKLKQIWQSAQRCQFFFNNPGDPVPPRNCFHAKSGKSFPGQRAKKSPHPSLRHTHKLRNYFTNNRLKHKTKTWHTLRLEINQTAN